MTDEEMMYQAMKEVIAYENEIYEHNKKIIDDLNAESDFADLLDGCTVSEKITIADGPKGCHTNERHGVFEDVYVDQWSVGMEGDSFNGFIYAKAKGVWYKIPYYC